MQKMLVDKGQIDLLVKAVIGNGQGLISRTARIEEKVIMVADMAKDAKEAVIQATEEAMKRDQDLRATAAAEHQENLNRYDRLADSLNTLTNDVTKLTDSVVEHHKTEHLAGLLGKPKFYLYITVVFVALHEIATAFGIGISDLVKLVFPK